MKNTARKRSIVTLLPVVLIMVMIFCFSAQSSEKSAEMSNVFEHIVWRILDHFFRTTPLKQEMLLPQISLIVRKLAHFTEFALLGFFLQLHMLLYRNSWLWSIIVSILYACSDEFHQLFVSGRSPDMLDVCIDSAGAMMGIIILLMLQSFIKRKRMSRKTQ